MPTYEAVTHSPGPWTLSDRLDDDGRLAINQDGAAVALVCARASSPASGPQYFEREANARLIATAPELLDELYSARNVIAIACGESAPFAKIALARIDAVIVKAGGR